jgi:hypothetical protein
MMNTSLPRTFFVSVLLCSLLPFHGSAGELSIQAATSGQLSALNTFTNGVLTLRRASAVDGAWTAVQNIFTTSTVAQATVGATNPVSLFRGEALDLSPIRPGFTNFIRAYGALTTIAGAGGPQEQNNWRSEYEGGPATAAVLSGPHMAMADRAGFIYIADKDAHAIRKILHDNTIVTVAGTSAPGDAPDSPVVATEGPLYEPNGVWVRGDGTFFILDLVNGKVRRVDTNGMMTTLFTVPGGISTGRGLWVSEDESVAYLSSGTVVKKWTAAGGVTDFSTGYGSLGNLVIDPWENVVVTDRGLHRVHRLDQNGIATPIAGNGGIVGGGDGALATETALEEVRGVWFLPTGAYLLATHRSNRVWYVDIAGYIHLLLTGNRFGTHDGDGTWFYNPSELRISECRAITVDYEGNILITENDVGYVRKIRFLPFEP